MQIVTSYVIGLLFGLGIVVGGMANPAKILNFFDLAGIPGGTWDPSLAFVMGGALAVTALGYRLVLRRPRPVLEPRFHLPTASRIDARLLAGAAVFGAGWGMAGFCPGGSLPALGTGRLEVAMFVAALVAGILGTRLVLSLGAPPARTTSTQTR